MSPDVASEIVAVNVPRSLAALNGEPPALFLPNAKTAERFFEFFTADIRNKNTRRAYYKAVCRFSEWCGGRGLRDLAHVKPMHVAAYIEGLQGENPEGEGFSKPTVKQHLAALRMLFDWLVLGHVLDVNPAHAVRGPKHRVKKGKTPVLTKDEARALLDSIAVTRKVKRADGTEHEIPLLTGLRDRALIGTMLYTFARVGAVLQMDVRDYFTQGRRSRVRLHEKGGIEHEAQCHHNLEVYLDEYIAAAGIAADKDGPLFRTTGRLTGTPHRMTQPDAYRMIQRRAKKAGIKTQIGNHSMRATGITAYLKNGGTREYAQAMAAHSSPRTTELYDRRADEITLDEYEKVGI
jgi:site-specific recombinase XerD